jgi:hypothetical protein
VAVLVAREGALGAPGPDALVVVPFGGAEHDWAALERASWLCRDRRTPERPTKRSKCKFAPRKSAGVASREAFFVS